MCVNIPLRAFEVYTRKMCVTMSLPCGQSLHKKDVRDIFLAVQAVCARSLHMKDVRDNFFTVRSKLTYERYA